MARKISTVLMSLLVVFQLAASPVVLAIDIIDHGDWQMIRSTDEMDGTVIKIIQTKSENILEGWANKNGQITLFIPCDDRRVGFSSSLRFEPTISNGYGFSQNTRIKFDEGRTFPAKFGVTETLYILGNDEISVEKRELTVNEMVDIDIVSANRVVIIDALKKAQKFKLEVELFNTEKTQIAKFNVAGLSEVLPHCDK